MTGTRTVYSLCGMCGARCPVEVTLQHNKVRWVCGNRHSPQGMALCPRGAAGVNLLDNDRRVLQPMLRRGPRGAGQWREVDWDEALEHVVSTLRDGMERYGPRSVLWSERPGPHSVLTRAFVRGLGSPNFCTHNATCRHNVDEAAYSLTGKDGKQWLYDYSRCKMLVLQGRNLFEALTTAEARTVMDALHRPEDKGGPCRLTVMDVRATISGAKAQRFWQVRPGTDYAVNLAVIHVLLRDNLCPPWALERLEGLEELRAFVRAYTPQWASAEISAGSGPENIVSPTDIENLARELADAAPAVIWHPGWMASRYTQSLMLCRSAWIINALLGSLGSPGGILPLPPARDAQGRGLFSLESLYPAPQEPRADGVGWKHAHLGTSASLLHEALAAAASGEPYPISAYMAYRHDPLTALPDAAELKQRLARIPLLVSITPTWSETAWHSDVVLPLPVYLENDLPLFPKPGLLPRIFRPARALDPQGQCRPDWQVISGLARGLGLDGLVFGSAAELWQRQLRDSGLSLADFDATGFVSLRDAPGLPAANAFPTLPTPSGKVELVSRRWAEAGVESLQAYARPTEPMERTENTEQERTALIPATEDGTACTAGRFRLIIGRVAQHTHASTQNLPLLAGQYAENTAWIHPDRARQLDIHDGELAMLDAGGIQYIRAHVTPDIHPEALFMVHGFGHTLPMERQACGRGAADQALMPGGLKVVDKTSLAPALQEHVVTLCKIRREFA